MLKSENTYGTLEWFKDEYEKVAGDPWGLTWRTSQMVRYLEAVRIAREIQPPVRRVLDVGCATGDFAKLIACQLRPEALLSVDFVDSAVQRARRRFPELNFSQESILDVGHRYAAQFDLVTCLEVLYYVEPDDRPAALRSLKQTLRPGGHVMFSSQIAPPPHFSSQAFLELVNHEFDIIAHQVLHLKLISLLERMELKIARLARRAAATTVPLEAAKLTRLPVSLGFAIERWSRCLGHATATHTHVLARRR